MTDREQNPETTTPSAAEYRLSDGGLEVPIDAGAQGTVFFSPRGLSSASTPPPPTAPVLSSGEGDVEDAPTHAGLSTATQTERSVVATMAPPVPATERDASTTLSTAAAVAGTLFEKLISGAALSSVEDNVATAYFTMLKKRGYGRADPDSHATASTLRFATLPALAEALESAIVQHDRQKLQKQTSTAAKRDGYRALLRFLGRDAQRAKDFLSGDIHVQELLLNEWCVTLANEVESRWTIRNYFRNAKTAFKILAESQNAQSPFRKLPLPRVPDEPGPRVPTYRVPDLVRAVQHRPWSSDLERARNTVIVFLMLYGGLRLGEVIGLENGDIQLDSRLLVLRDTKGPDGGTSRTVPIGVELEKALRGYMALRKHRPETAFLVSLRRRSGENGIGEKTVERVLRDVEETFGMHLTAHMLRRTMIDLMIEARIEEDVRMKIVGHKDVRTHRHYGTITQAQMHQAMLLIDGGAQVNGRGAAPPAAFS